MTSVSSPVARAALAAVTCTTFIAACDHGGDWDDPVELVGEPATAGQETPIATVPFEVVADPNAAGRAQVERRVLLRTAGAYRRFFGAAPPASIDFPREWAVFYAAGVKPTGGFTASVLSIDVRRGRGPAVLDVVTRLESPGEGCVVTQALSNPHVLVKFAAQRGAPRAQFRRDDVVRNCGVPTNPCAAVLCPVGTRCVVLEKFPPEARCVPIPPPVKVFCGGIAGIPCPGAGTCVDDPDDSCDPMNGGADCGGFCRCDVIQLCIEGHVFDQAPNVCACVPVKPPARERCGSATCGADQFCCNPSCAICAPRGGFCTQQACDPPK